MKCLAVEALAVIPPPAALVPVESAATDKTFPAVLRDYPLLHEEHGTVFVLFCCIRLNKIERRKIGEMGGWNNGGGKIFLF